MNQLDFQIEAINFGVYLFDYFCLSYKGLSYDAFIDTNLIPAAVIREIEIMGEAAKKAIIEV